MAAIKELIAKCKEGNIQEAYDIALADYESQSNNVWAHREVGWVLYYFIREDAENGRYASLIEHLDALKALNLLNITADVLIFNNVLLQIGQYLKKHLIPTDVDSPAKLSTLFSKIKDYTFSPSVGYSVLLQGFIKCDGWGEMVDFLDWWNFDNLALDDYAQFETARGRKIMSLAERAYIAKAKALLRLNDQARIEEFLAPLLNLMNTHPEMTWPGYCYAKLLMVLGSNAEDALRVIVPFARKKVSEFWVWQLISEIFANDNTKQFACLLRAVSCRTQETFLGKVRIKIAELYIRQGRYDCAKYHIDKVIRCYVGEGWRIPNEIENWLHESWVNTVQACDQAPIDYMSITDNILLNGAEECVAVVTYVDPRTHVASLIYGKEKRMGQRLRLRVKPGDVIRLFYTTDNDGRVRVLSSRNEQLSEDLDYAKKTEGDISRNSNNPFAFLRCQHGRCFVSPALVQKHNLQNGDRVHSFIVYDYNRSKETWNWVSITINR